MASYNLVLSKAVKEQYMLAALMRAECDATTVHGDSFIIEPRNSEKARELMRMDYEGLERRYTGLIGGYCLC